ncbi:MAG: phosphotransferase family protein [Burkholderiaceae bacterium]
MTNDVSSTDQPDTTMVISLRGAGLVGQNEIAQFERLTGGVSSDIWKVTTTDQTFCVKRALAQLKVQAEWLAPVERNQFEVDWYNIANAIVPASAPEVLFHDAEHMLFAMTFLDPSEYRLWKSELRDGRAHETAARQLGQTLVQIHAATANNDEVAARFPRTDIFHAIRLEPYLEATATRHPACRDALFDLSKRTAGIQRTLIHGDVSPKNILIGPDAPVILDAECACMGDPAFDLAFCLNHLLLKSIWNPSAAPEFDACFEAMSSAYLNGVNWESSQALEQRAATLLAGLFLARVDGKSPVEYITSESERNRVRRCATRLLQQPPDTLGQVLHAWQLERDQHND